MKPLRDCLQGLFHFCECDGFIGGLPGPSTPLRFAQDDSGALRIRLRRFRKRATAIVLQENNRPAHLRAEKIEGISVAQEGPFAISGNWWERAWARAEWDVELENGTIARCHCDNSGWAVDGIYD